MIDGPGFRAGFCAGWCAAAGLCAGCVLMVRFPQPKEPQR